MEGLSCLLVCSAPLMRLSLGSLVTDFYKERRGLEQREGVGGGGTRGVEKRLCLWFYGLIPQLDFLSSRERHCECIIDF